MYFSLADDALAGEQIDYDSYIIALRIVEDELEGKKATASFLNPFKALKFSLQALALDTMFGYCRWVKETWLKKCNDIREKAHLFTLTNDNENYFKIFIDFASNMPQGVFRTILSVHASGLASIPLTTEGILDEQFEHWDVVKERATPSYVKEDIINNPNFYQQSPDMITKQDLTVFFEQLAPAISVLFRFGPKKACLLTPKEHFYWKRKYVRKFGHYIQLYRHGMNYFAQKLQFLISPIGAEIAEINRMKKKIPELQEHYQHEFINCKDQTTFKHLQELMETRYKFIEHQVFKRKSIIRDIYFSTIFSLYLKQDQRAKLTELLREWIFHAIDNCETRVQLQVKLDKLIIDFCDYYSCQSHFLKNNVEKLFTNREQRSNGLFKLASELRVGS